MGSKNSSVAIQELQLQACTVVSNVHQIEAKGRNGLIEFDRE